MTDSKVRLMYEYADLILNCEKKLMLEYKLNSIPYLNKDVIPKSGELQFGSDLLVYNFHGSGCTFFWRAIELSYDIYLNSKNYIVTSPWEFKCFVNSYLKTETSESEIASWLEDFDNQGILKKIYENYSVYELDLEWYKSFCSGVSM